MPVDRATAGHVQGQSQHLSLPFSHREALARMMEATWGSSGWPGHAGSMGVAVNPTVSPRQVAGPAQLM